MKNSVKIDGRPFDRIKAKVAAKQKATEDANRITKEAHDALWDAIHDEYPQLSRDANLNLDVEYEDIGFYVVKESEGRISSGFLKALKASLKD
ncbi:hypothetical protein ACYOEI_00380 [Singulisphaera rosea]